MASLASDVWTWPCKPHNTHIHGVIINDNFPAKMRVCLGGPVWEKLGTVSGPGMLAVGNACWQPWRDSSGSVG